MEEGPAWAKVRAKAELTLSGGLAHVTVAPKAGWAQTARGARCGLPALGDSVL